MKIQRDSLTYTLLVTSIFGGKLIGLALLIIAVVLAYPKLNYPINKKLGITLASIILCSLGLVFWIGYSPNKTLQQGLLLTIYLFLYSFLFAFIKERNSFNHLFNTYVKIAYIVSFLGIIQFIVFFVSNIDIFIFASKGIYEFSPRILRIHSIVGEPGSLAGLLLPALGYYLHEGCNENIGMTHKRFFVILSVFILTFSVAGYVILSFIGAIIIIRKSWKKVLMSFATLMLLILTIGDSKPIQKTIGVVDVVFNNATSMSNPQVFDNLNASSYAIISNLYVASNAPLRITGTGLGTHAQNYYSTYYSTRELYGQNAQDAYSLLIRIFSEFGIIGIILFAGFIFRNTNFSGAINIASLAYILQVSIRGGHYTAYGTLFFLFLLYYTSKKNSLTKYCSV